MVRHWLSKKERQGHKKLVEEILRSGVKVLQDDKYTAEQKKEEIELFIKSENYLLYADLLNISRFYMKRKVFEIIYGK